jgi:hypothetical protein
VTTRELRTAVDEILTGRLGERGYKRVKEGIYLLPILPRISGWTGIGLASYKRGAEVDADPMIGVRHDDVEELMPRLSGEADPTILRPLYELLPGESYKTWSFTESNLNQKADELVKSLAEYGQGLMQELTGLDAIREALATWAFADTRRTRLPAVLLLQGDREAAEDEIARQKRALANAGDKDVEAEYEEFATRLLAEPSGGLVSRD